MQITVGELARLVEGQAEGPTDVIISGVRAVGDAGEDHVVVAENERFFRQAAESKAACIVAAKEIATPVLGKSVVLVDDTGEALIRILDYFKPSERIPTPGVAGSAVVGKGVSLGAGVAIGANCFVGDGAAIGDGTVLYPGAYVGECVTIGRDCRIHPCVTIYPRCVIGDRVVLHAGVVIGADGFGYKPGKQGLVKVPQIGTVEIGDDVEIGANSTVDRAKFGATIIGSGSKIDNLVHVAHNVKIGRNCVIVALSGVAGSAEIGDNVTLAAQTGVKDNVRIGDGCVVAARAGVIGNLRENSIVSGFPARDHVTEKKAQAAWLRLPELIERLRVLEREVERLRAQEKG
ncbi:MAG: UDP-3-O-(3-hydroxymyristoyl)glucosamine N-acyltransferase [Armatimonadetes bacterium]|nr:UDP-3-O-(3-hydroxymyristoyl)glucosamine N-acyltransferase [Armatimonadota bacterium]